MPESLPSNDTIRAIIEAPIKQLVEVGLEGGERAALHMLAFQYILRLDSLGDTEALMRLRKEIDNAIQAAEDEAGGIQ